MANFDPTTTARRDSVKLASSLLDMVRHVYRSAKSVQDMLTLYQAGTDTAFNAAVNALFTSAERTELSAMLSQINALVIDWETNHAGAIAGG